MTKLSNKLDDQARTKNFMGKLVKGRGKLGMKSNAIEFEQHRTHPLIFRFNTDLICGTLRARQHPSG